MDAKISKKISDEDLKKLFHTAIKGGLEVDVCENTMIAMVKEAESNYPHLLRVLGAEKEKLK